MSALHLLDDFIECNYNPAKISFVLILLLFYFYFYSAIETIPSEVQQQLQLLNEKDFQIEGNINDYHI